MESPKLKRLIIIGASGHGKVVADIARLNGYSDIIFLDKNSKIKECAGYSVLGPDNIIDEIMGDVFVAIGNSKIRKKIMNRNNGRNFPVLIHPKAVVAEDVIIGEGSVVMAGAVINPGTKIGRGSIINTTSSVDHDCILGEFVHVAVGAHLCGAVAVGNDTWVGAGATVRNNIRICSECLIGAGAVVVKNITEPGIYMGVPSKNISIYTENGKNE